MDKAYKQQLDDIQAFAAMPPSPRSADVARQLSEMRARARRLIMTGDEPDAAGASRDVNALSELPPAARHRIEAALGRVRHSAVESCFYNLQLYAGMLESDNPPPQIESKVDKALAGIDDASGRIEAMLGEKISGDRPVQEYFTAEAERVRDGIAGLRKIKAEWGKNPSAHAGPSIGRCVDQVMDQLARMQARLDGSRMELGAAVESAAEAEQPRLEQMGIVLDLNINDAAEARLFLNEASFSDAIAELIRNSARHGFAGMPAEGRSISISTQWADSLRRNARIVVKDNGRGIKPEDSLNVMTRGYSTAGGTGEGLPMIRRVIESDHLGRFEIVPTEFHGTEIQIDLPIKAELKN